MKKLVILFIILLVSSVTNAQVIDHVFEPFKVKADTSAINAHVKNMNIPLKAFSISKNGLITFCTNNKLSAIEIVLLCNRYVRVPDEYRFKIFIGGKEQYDLTEREIHKWSKL